MGKEQSPGTIENGSDKSTGELIKRTENTEEQDREGSVRTI